MNGRCPCEIFARKFGKIVEEGRLGLSHVVTRDSSPRQSKLELSPNFGLKRLGRALESSGYTARPAMAVRGVSFCSARSGFLIPVSNSYYSPLDKALIRVAPWICGCKWVLPIVDAFCKLLCMFPRPTGPIS